MDDLDVFEALLQIAIKESHEHLTSQDVIARLNDPKWDEYQRVHNWRRYVPGELVPLWEHLTVQAQLTAYISAVKQAMAENWS